MRKMNAHWRNYYRTCSPCDLNYEYIVKTETYSEDLHYLVKKLRIAEVREREREKGKLHFKITLHLFIDAYSTSRQRGV